MAVARVPWRNEFSGENGVSQTMPRGRRPKPTHLKVIAGTFRADRSHKDEPKPRPLLRLDPPRGLDRHARTVWRQLAPLLQRLSLLTEADVFLFQSLCQAWARYVRAQQRAKTILARPMKLTQEHLDLVRRVEISAEKGEHAFRLLAVEFGLSPSSRTRLGVEDSNAEIDEFEDFLNSRP